MLTKRPIDRRRWLARTCRSMLNRKTAPPRYRPLAHHRHILLNPQKESIRTSQRQQRRLFSTVSVESDRCHEMRSMQIWSDGGNRALCAPATRIEGELVKPRVFWLRGKAPPHWPISRPARRVATAIDVIAPDLYCGRRRPTKGRFLDGVSLREPSTFHFSGLCPRFT